MQIHELVFSPTGGTQKAVRLLTQSWDQPIVHTDLCAPETDFSKIVLQPDDHAFIAMPSFGGRAPAVAMERLRQIQGNGADCTLVCVYGNRAYEDTLAEMEDAARESGFQIHSAVAAIAQHSILPQYAPDRPDRQDEEQLAGFAVQIREKVTGSPAVPGNRPYKKEFKNSLVPSPSSSCSQCGLCAQSCPVSAINPQTLLARKDLCIGCMRCVALCPEQVRSANKALRFAAGQALKKTCGKRKDNELFL